MASDDFSDYSKLLPSVYFLLHTNNDLKGISAPNHNPHFDLDEDLLIDGVASYIAIALDFLK
jgi:amidohydrolase